MIVFNNFYREVEGNHHLHLNTPEVVLPLIKDFIQEFSCRKRRYLKTSWHVNSFAPMVDALFYTKTVTRAKIFFFCQETLQAYCRVEFSLNFKILSFKKCITNVTIFLFVSSSWVKMDYFSSTDVDKPENLNF